MAKLYHNEFIITHYFVLAVSIEIPLLPIIKNVTYYYVFETKQLADDSYPFPSCGQVVAVVFIYRGELNLLQKTIRLREKLSEKQSGNI